MLHRDIYLELITDSSITNLISGANIDVVNATGNPRLAIFQSGYQPQGEHMAGCLTFYTPIMRFVVYSSQLSEAYSITTALRTKFAGKINQEIGSSTVANISLNDEGDLEPIAPQDNSQSYLYGRYIDFVFEITE